jgi:tRNA (cytidine/uridine-2'-O-)-methyltransferase
VTPRLLLFGLQSPINIGMILRVAETYECRVSVFDPHDVFSDAQSCRVISDFACGALQRVPPAVFTNPGEFRSVRGHSRLVATVIEPDSVALPDFTWQAGDLLALGNEYDGLPPEMMDQATVRLRIPMPDVYTPKPVSYHPTDPTRTAPVARDGMLNLNVAMAAAILIYSAYAQARRRSVPTHGATP